MITKIRTQPTLFERVWRSDAICAYLLVLMLFAACGTAELICWLTGVGEI